MFVLGAYCSRFSDRNFGANYYLVKYSKEIPCRAVTLSKDQY
jgi:hypothetical protein